MSYLSGSGFEPLDKMADMIADMARGGKQPDAQAQADAEAKRKAEAEKAGEIIPGISNNMLYAAGAGVAILMYMNTKKK